MSPPTTPIRITAATTTTTVVNKYHLQQQCNVQSLLIAMQVKFLPDYIAEVFGADTIFGPLDFMVWERTR